MTPTTTTSSSPINAAVSASVPSTANAFNGNAAALSGAGSSADGGLVAGNNNGGNGGDGGNAVLIDPSFGGDTSSSNTAVVAQLSGQQIRQVPTAVQNASSAFNAFSLGI